MVVVVVEVALLLLLHVSIFLFIHLLSPYLTANGCMFVYVCTYLSSKLFSLCVERRGGGGLLICVTSFHLPPTLLYHTIVSPSSTGINFRLPFDFTDCGCNALLSARETHLFSMTRHCGMDSLGFPSF